MQLRCICLCCICDNTYNKREQSIEIFPINRIAASLDVSLCLKRALLAKKHRPAIPPDLGRKLPAFFIALPIPRLSPENLRQNH